jgi:hypothetical protein
VDAYLRGAAHDPKEKYYQWDEEPKGSGIHKFDAWVHQLFRVYVHFLQAFCSTVCVRRTNSAATKAVAMLATVAALMLEEPVFQHRLSLDSASRENYSS